VASGTFAYTSIVTRPVARALTFNDIFLTEPMDFRDDLINFVGTQTDLMHNLGEITGIPIVIDGDLGPPQLLATIAPASMHLASPYAHSAPDQATVDKLLDLVSQQTSLTFKREKRTVPTWCLVDADK
jgi:hypothetical protein